MHLAPRYSEKKASSVRHPGLLLCCNYFDNTLRWWSLVILFTTCSKEAGITAVKAQQLQKDSWNDSHYETGPDCRCIWMRQAHLKHSAYFWAFVFIMSTKEYHPTTLQESLLCSHILRKPPFFFSVCKSLAPLKLCSLSQHTIDLRIPGEMSRYRSVSLFS